MNDAQKKWTDKQLSVLEHYCEKHFPLSDDEWCEVVRFMDTVVKLAKGNEEVRDALFDRAKEWDRRQRNAKERN